MSKLSVSLGSEDQLPRTIYRFGSYEFGHYGHVVLGRDGKVKAYAHPNEHRYRLEGENFTFMREDGSETSKLRWHPAANVFLPADACQHFLLPVLTLAPRMPSTRSARIVVNTIPKAGTYLIQDVLARLGYQSLDLHLGGNTFHDNRRVPKESVHSEPHTRRVTCPSSAVAALMEEGEFAVGHIADEAEIRGITNAAVCVLHGVRDLRDVLVSLFRFKQKSVASLSPSDDLWRTMEGKPALQAFLVHFAEKDVAFIRDVASTILRQDAIRFRFEDIQRGYIGPEVIMRLNEVDAELGSEFVKQLPASIGSTTSTLSREPSRHEEYWNPAVQAFFVKSGLADVNAALGYENLG